MQHLSSFLYSRNIKLGLDLTELITSKFRIKKSVTGGVRQIQLSRSAVWAFHIKYFQTSASTTLFTKNAILPSETVQTQVNRLMLEVQVVKTNPKSMADPKRFLLNSAIIRYEPNGERFQFSFTLKSGKVFNFDRSVTETLASFETRVVTNMSKKLKETEVTAKLLLPPTHGLDDPIKSVLDGILQDSTEIHFQINNEEGINVQVNPPEVYVIKFHPKAYIGFPLLPHKIEANSNFDGDKSLYKWEYTRDRIGKVPIKNKNGRPIQSAAKETWIPCDTTNSNDNNLMIVPDETLEGATLRLTCTPSSDGKRFGAPFTEEFPSPLERIPVPSLLFEERLSRLDSIDSKDPNVLRFVSYNILADTYTTPEWFCNSPPESLEFSYRLSLLRKELASYNADIICLQEVDEKAFTGDYAPFFKVTGNRAGIFSCKVGNTREGLASFHNPEKLALLEWNTVHILEAMKLLPFWNVISASETLKLRLEERNTVAQISVLENKNAEKSLLVLGVTHLYFHPNADHIRLLQTMTCLRSLEAKVEELKQRYPDRKIRVFFCGDFNCTPPYGAYRLMTTGKVGTNDDDWVYHEPEKLVPGIEFQHNLQLINSHMGQELTNITLNFEGCIDYILYQAEKAKLIKAYPPPDKATIAAIVGCKDYSVSLPNLHAPSDHLPLIADISLC